MNIKKAIEHFIWKFDNVWKMTRDDKDAMNSIIKFVNEKYEQQLNDYHLFAKLYIFMLDNYISKNNIPLLDLQENMFNIELILKKPVQQHVEEFTVNRNMDEFYLKLKNDIECPISENLSHIHETRVEDFLKEDMDPIEKAIKIREFREYKIKKREHLSKVIEEQPHLFEKFDFTYSDIEEILTSMINKIIREFS